MSHEEAKRLISSAMQILICVNEHASDLGIGRELDNANKCAYAAYRAIG